MIGGFRARVLRRYDETTPDSPESTADGVVVGVVADPVAAPAFIAQRIEHDLPGLLAEQMPGRAWRVEVVLEQLPPSDSCHSEMMEFATERMQQHGWDVAVCVTDLPLVSGKQPVVADASNSRQVAVVSLPAFGAMALHRRVRGVVIQLIADLRGEGAPGENTEEHRRRRLPALGRAFRRVTPDQEGIDLRILASRGRLRLLIGMVRDNQPWRLVFGLRGALVGAFAFSAFYLLNTTVWELALTMAPLQRLATVLGSLAVLVTWLIIYHHLWERTRNRPPRPPSARASTARTRSVKPPTATANASAAKPCAVPSNTASNNTAANTSSSATQVLRQTPERSRVPGDRCRPGCWGSG